MMATLHKFDGFGAFGLAECTGANCEHCADMAASESRDRAWIERELGDVPATGPNRRVLHGEFPLDAMIDTSQRQQRSEPGSWAY